MVAIRRTGAARGRAHAEELAGQTQPRGALGAAGDHRVVAAATSRGDRSRRSRFGRCSLRAARCLARRWPYSSRPMRIHYLAPVAVAALLAACDKHENPAPNPTAPQETAAPAPEAPKARLYD